VRNGKDISQVTTKFLVMNGGRLVFEGTETELQASKDPYVRKFVREGGA
jgi:ABC-type transporter Mla maintaining outer membrane lipid asymmetry ATPase subunit MlaF